MVPFRRVCRFVAVAAVFTVAAAASCWGIRAIAPFPRIAQVADKLDAIGKTEEPFDVLFFGSSKIYSGVIPERFDKAMANHEFKIRSYNLGVDGMGYPESGYMCEKALAAHPGPVQWVFLEVSNVRVHVPPNQRDTRRFKYWHDYEHTRLVADAIAARKAVPAGRAMEDPDEFLRLHWKAFLTRSLNLGEGAELASERLDRPEKREGRDVLDPKLRGYVAIKDVMAGTELRNFREGLAKFGKKPKDAEGFTELALRAFAAEVAEKGAKTILIGTPNPAPNPQLFSTGEPGPPFFNFADPGAYPLVYREDFRGDAAHLNHAGAEAFTDYLAERFAAHLRALAPSQR